MANMISTAIVQQQNGCGVASQNRSSEVRLAPPGLVSEDSSPPNLSQAELGMLMKAIQQFVSEFPKLDLGDSATRGTRLPNKVPPLVWV